MFRKLYRNENVKESKSKFLILRRAFCNFRLMLINDICVEYNWEKHAKL